MKGKQPMRESPNDGSDRTPSPNTAKGKQPMREAPSEESTALSPESALKRERLPPNCLLGSTPVATFGDILAHLRDQRHLSEGAFIRLLQQAQAMVKTVYGHELKKCNKAFDCMENIARSRGVADLDMPPLPPVPDFSKTSGQTRKPKKPSDQVKRNRLNAGSARVLVPQKYPRYGQGLLTKFPAEHARRKLVTLTYAFPDETQAIGAINRAILNRITKSQTSQHGMRGHMIFVSVLGIDLTQAASLEGKSWTIPTDAELRAAKLVVDPETGTLQSHNGFSQFSTRLGNIQGSSRSATPGPPSTRGGNIQGSSRSAAPAGLPDETRAKRNPPSPKDASTTKKTKK